MMRTSPLWSWALLASLVVTASPNVAVAQARGGTPHLVEKPLGAEDSARKPRDPNWDLYGFARLRLIGLDDFSLDTHGARAGRDGWLESRLLLGGSYKPNQNLEITVELDALNGQATGGFTSLGTIRGQDTFSIRRDTRFGAGLVLPRKAFLRYDTPFGRLVIGQQAFGWGLGVVSNSGSTETDFGDVYQGNLVERAAFFAMPFARKEGASELLRGLGFFVAADIPFRDDNASLLAGDFAWSALVGSTLRTRQFEAGVFEAMRRQKDRDDPSHPGHPELNVFVTDAYTKLFLNDRFASQTFMLEGEMAFIAGHTTRPYLEKTYKDGASVQSFGGVARFRFDDRDLRLTAKLELGYASGDNDGRDDVVRQFTFNTDYNVGLILFDQILPMLTARAVDQISSPSKIGLAPPSARFLVNQGAVSNAVYVYPTLRWRPFGSLDLRLGYVAAFGAADIVDPYQSAKNGGYNTTFGGKSPGTRMLGHEVDIGLRYGFHLGAGATLRLGYEAGMFFQGTALSGLADSRPTWMARALSDLQF